MRHFEPKARYFLSDQESANSIYVAQVPFGEGLAATKGAFYGLVLQYRVVLAFKKIKFALS